MFFWLSSMELYGVDIPFWAVFLVGIIVALVAWKLIKFALVLIVIIVIIFVVLMGLDFLDIFGKIQNLFFLLF